MSTVVRTIAHEICTNLDEQVRVWRRLLELSQAQLAALQQQDVHGVHAILQEIEIAMLERSRAEVRRGMLLEQAGHALGIDASEVTRERIAACCDAPLRETLERAAEELRCLVVELDAIVLRNRAMLEQELGIVDALISGITVDRSVRPTYGRTGAQAEAPRLRLLDAQV